MKKSRLGNKAQKISLMFVGLIVALSLIGYSYGLWYEELYIVGNIRIASWDAGIRVWKELDGVFTDPETGADLTEPNRTHIAVAADFPSKFILIIYVENTGSTSLTNIVITDTLKNTITYRACQASKGSVDIDPPSNDGFQQEKITWTIDEMQPGDIETLTIYIETLANPSGKFEPTSGDDGDWQDVEINEGATVSATSQFNGLSATTDGIILVITDNGIIDDGIGLISSPELPYSTPWAEDEYP